MLLIDKTCYKMGSIGVGGLSQVGNCVTMKVQSNWAGT